MITLGATTAATIESDTGPNMVIAALDERKKLEDWHSTGIALIMLEEGARVAVICSRRRNATKKR